MKLWSKNIPFYNNSIEFKPYPTEYIVDGAKTAIVVCPGGGYTGRAVHEGREYAEWLNSIGISAVVLEYRMAPYQAPVPACDVQRAMRVVRYELTKLGVEKVGVMGSSAGGHLAATASVHYDKCFYEPQDEIDDISARPDFTILCYPVIDMYEYRHDGSKTNLLGGRAKTADKDFYSLHKQVTDDTPTAFLWHTSTDNAVPAENSMLYAMALSEHLIPYELHIYPEGGHGMGLANGNAYIHEWCNALERWLKSMI